ncbi:MAG: YbjN domain-containing protein [Desulfobulbaceae bacterium]|nr:YbjN domain-containing protein [Desulfobulbaceae bacterium]
MNQSEASLDPQKFSNLVVEYPTKNTKEKLQMQEELITSENLSPELLKSIFDAAFMESTTDEDGEVLVKESVTVRVKANMEQKNRIRLYCIFSFEENSTQLARLECVNRITGDYAMLKASVHDNLLIIAYDMWIAGGITKKNLVTGLKFFATIPHDAIADYGQEIVQ